jgi:hypothetical protein
VGEIGSFRTQDSTTGIGMVLVLRDETDRIILSACRFLPSCEEAFEVELWACSVALALQYSQLPIIIDSGRANLIGNSKSIPRLISVSAHYL